MTLAEIATVVGGTVHDDPGVTVTGPAFLDTRAPEAGGLFAAFVGEHADGHDYVDAAIAGGAVAVLGTRTTGAPTVLVDDTRLALAALAHHVLGRIGEVKVVALTGSQGKTGTKDLLAQVLMGAGNTVATRGNLNNEIGVPLTVLRADRDTELLVLEMGARGVGNLTELCTIAPPDVAVVLNVGKAHIGEFGSVEAIAQAKGELVEALGRDGVAVLNADDPRVAAMAGRTTGTVLTFGETPGADVHLEDVHLDDLGRPAFTLRRGADTAGVHLRLLGEHQAMNAAAAATAALALGLDLATVAESLSAAEPTSRQRMEVHERSDGVTVVNDAYNANPDSMRAALETLAALGRGRASTGSSRAVRTVAVLGEMFELGEASPEEHEGVGRLAVHLDINQLLVVGEGARPIHRGASLEDHWDGESAFVSDNDEAVAWLAGHLRPGDIVLVKGSRAARLETVAEAILGREDTGATAPTPLSGEKETDR